MQVTALGPPHRATLGNSHQKLRSSRNWNCSPPPELRLCTCGSRFKADLILPMHGRLGYQTRRGEGWVQAVSTTAFQKREGVLAATSHPPPRGPGHKARPTQTWEGGSRCVVGNEGR